MSKFIFKCVLFMLPITVGAYLIDIFLSQQLSQSNQQPGEIEVWKKIYESQANCELAIYGSSRAWVHISPKILADSLNFKVYNFGINGHNFWLQYLRHLEYLKYNKKPKTILLSLDIFTLQKNKDLYESDQFLPYMLWNKNIYNYTKSFQGFSKLDYFVPLVRYYDKVKAKKFVLDYTIHNPQLSNFRENGYLGMNLTWNNDLDKAKEEKTLIKIDFDKNTILLFEQFVNECKKLKINLKIVYTPEFIDGQIFVSNRKQMIDYYKDISRKHQIEFLDYSNDSLSFDKNYFYNALHLNKNGSEIFSKKLARDLKLRHIEN